MFYFGFFWFYRVVSTIQIQHTESYRCVLRAIGIEKQVSQPHIVSKTIAANRFESYRFVSVSVGVCFEGPFGARRAAASCCCAGGCLAREALAKSLRGCLEETLFGKPRKQTETASSRFHVEHFPGLIRDSCNQPRPEINLTRRVRSFLRVPTSQNSSGTAATSQGQKST